MKKLMLALVIVLASSQAFACKYSLTLNYELSEKTICSNAIKAEQLTEDTYRIRFLNYVPGTKISYQTVNIHLNGQVSEVEKEFMTLHEILKNYNVGNLYFDQTKEFKLIYARDSHYFFSTEAESLLKSINAKLR